MRANKHDALAPVAATSTGFSSAETSPFEAASLIAKMMHFLSTSVSFTSLDSMCSSDHSTRNYIHDCASGFC